MKALGWVSKEATPPNASLLVTELNQRGLHTWLGLLGYLQQDMSEHHFDLMTKNVTDEELHERS